MNRWVILLWICLSFTVVASCQVVGEDSKPSIPTSVTKAQDTLNFDRGRSQMVERQLRDRGIEDPAVLAAMQRVPRHRFVPSDLVELAYQDSPLPIGYDQTISQPYIVAYMSEVAQIAPGDRVLEIGTGSGYQAAILAQLARQVYTIEIIPELAASASATLQELGYQNIEVKAGDGYRGWPEAAPFEAIVVTAAPDRVPQALIEQLAIGGKLVIPVGTSVQQMTIITKTEEGIVEEQTLPVRFVPMTGGS
ncbi:protein-L-isoaspartate(D-aspartate) O-methyltransferase [Oxynema sp. CENA135]|uniref:protein-L-isoaspartate(D-aspartate) O-methyltransferase n=1 Tax=Oxynema sp. CENA135 TaxID=984206 RepID=UPI00190A985A|nr:protein-L-isoaspartate(D-aspartate) O-methyltransferase [Oxynema sp. CENA135]MBK4732496.1 protein-L-isoaspartate(D-aspartate) O-methyltransferase [Oxynema sp. CENA135]